MTGEVTLLQLVQEAVAQEGRTMDDVLDVIATVNPLFFVIVFHDGSHLDMTIVPPTH